MTFLTFLGTGFSSGVPDGPCDCWVCEKARNKEHPFFRTRSSVLIQHNGNQILIDPGTDFWHQCVQEKIRKLDAVLLTHSHEDHSGGIPDLRSFAPNWSEKPALPFYCRKEDFELLQQRFAFIFDSKIVSSKPKFDFRIISSRVCFNLFGLEITPFWVSHPPHDALGYRINNLAYIPDLLDIPKESLPVLDGIEKLVIMANSDESYSKQMSVYQAIELAQRLKAKEVFFTHIGHRIQRNGVEEKFAPHMKLAFDGLKIEFD